MINVLFLQSEMTDPYAFYASMRSEHPVYYDTVNNIWAVYTYHECKMLIENSTALVTSPVSKLTEDNELNKIIKHLVRLTNGQLHQASRVTAHELLRLWKFSSIGELCSILIGSSGLPARIEWVDAVAKRLPVLYLLKGYSIPVVEILPLIPKVEILVKLMGPVNDETEIEDIQTSVQLFKNLFEKYISKKINTVDTTLHFINFIGLLIQSYEASRGLLSYVMLNFIKYPEHKPTNELECIQFVKECARYESAVQNTRRVLSEELILKNQVLTKGDQLLLVLGSANRDVEINKQAGSFFPGKNPDSLSFGAGAHKCIAEQFVIQLAAQLLLHLQGAYKCISLVDSSSTVEPKINVRLPKYFTITVE